MRSRPASSSGVWHATPEDARLRQEALSVVPHGRYRAMAVSPLESGRLDPPDICLIYATPGQMILFINGLQWRGYRKFDWSVVGETACADSWGRALATGEPSLSLPCFAERRFGGVPDDEMLMALPPRYLPIAIEGMKALAKNGIRYPMAPYGIQNDVRAGTRGDLRPEAVARRGARRRRCRVRRGGCRRTARTAAACRECCRSSARCVRLGLSPIAL